MSIIATSQGQGSKIPLHPKGQFPARIIDVIDRGIVKTMYNGEEKEKHKVTIRFYCGKSAKVQWKEDEPEQDVALWVDKWFTLSLHEKANLRAFVETWLDTTLTEQQAKRYDVEAALLDTVGYLHIKHSPDGRYANVGTAMPLPDGLEAPDVPDGYVRVKDREPREGTRPTQFDDDDDSLPF